MMIDANVYRENPGLKPGLGGFTDLTCAEADAAIAKMSDWEKGWYNPWYQWVKSVKDSCATIPALYSYVEYGKIPAPKPMPPPIAPKTEEQMTVPGAWTPEMSTPDLQAWIAEQQAQIKAAEAAGTYNPAGNTPLPNAITWDKYKWWFIGGAALLYFTLLYQGGKAYVRYRYR